MLILSQPNGQKQFNFLMAEWIGHEYRTKCAVMEMLGWFSACASPPIGIDKVHGPWLMAHGSRLMAQEPRKARGPRAGPQVLVQARTSLFKLGNYKETIGNYRKL